MLCHVVYDIPYIYTLYTTLYYTFQCGCYITIYTMYTRPIRIIYYTIDSPYAIHTHYIYSYTLYTSTYVYTLHTTHHTHTLYHTKLYMHSTLYTHLIIIIYIYHKHHTLYTIHYI